MKDVTKKYSTLAEVTGAASFILLVLPMLLFSAKALVEGEPHQKFVLGISATVALILTCINVIMKISLRSTLWIMLLGIYVCLDNIQVLLIILAITTIIDEIMLEPMHRYYKQKASINREIDKRLT